jgi:epoxyqueuosine reductase
MTEHNYQDLAQQIKFWSSAEGFQQAGITDTDLGDHEQHLNNWLDKDYAGEMAYLSKHGSKRSRPAELLPGTVRVICFRLDYLTDSASPKEIIASDQQAYVARYSLGRDYHKVIRQKLKRIWQKSKPTFRSTTYHQQQAEFLPIARRCLRKHLHKKLVSAG